MASYHTTLDDLKQKYFHNVQAYIQIPEDDIKVFELEELALNRLRLLKLFDKVTSDDCVKYSTQWNELIVADIRAKYPTTFYKLCEKEVNLDNPSKEELLARQLDHISHFILRMVCCNDIQLHNWFINREADWLYLRYQKQDAKGKELFFKLNHLDYEQVNDEDRKNICDKFAQYSDNEIFRKVHFKQALNLIKNRKVRLYKGYAYVPSFLLIYCIIDRFKSFLHRVLSCTKRNMVLINDEQVAVITQISKILDNEKLTINTTRNLHQQNCNVKIQIANLNKYARNNFPLCMEHLYNKLKEDHHLKYGSRLQLGNFLKSLGLSLEESLELWKTEFTYKITEATFQKKYSYFLKHMYGTVGSMKEYPPFTCSNIIDKDINIEEAHGCPFKTWDSLHLTRKLQQCGFSALCIDNIEGQIRNQQYEKGCGIYFRLRHSQTEEPKISSPLEYFQQSLTLSKVIKPNDISSDEDDDF